MRVVIADDETLARERLKRFLNDISGSEVVGEAAEGGRAVELCQQQRPDVVLLDIRMPGVDGLEAARHIITLAEPPAIIFTTAYGDYALQAFETQAIDYLLKPIRKERLEQALGRAERLSVTRLEALREEGGKRARTHLSVTSHGTLRLVPLNEVLYFQADMKYVTARTRGESLLLDESLKSLEDEFAERLLRIHRNALVMKEALVGLERDNDGGGVALIRDVSDKLEISRRHLPEVRRWIKGRE
ncbi:MAG TPA: LytTR family DNA-binding domain-containing protein [Gammaproteobacteria bacterium]